MKRLIFYCFPVLCTGGLLSFNELLPTILEMAGVSLPAGLNGRSYLDVLTKGKLKHDEKIFLTHFQDGNMNISPMRGIRTLRYKYILNLAPQYPFTTHADKAKKHDGDNSYFNSWERLAQTDEHARQLLDRYHNRPGEELYDIVNDPDEMYNLAEEKKYAPVIRQFRRELQDWRRSQQDTITGPAITNEPSKF